MTQDVLFGDQPLTMSDHEAARLSPEARRERLATLLADSDRIIEQALEQHLGKRTLAASVLLFSGGNDSTVLAHLMRHRATHAAHANTGIGIEQTRQFVRDTCADWGLPLLERHPPPGSTYRELVLDQGFPGPAHHWKMYTRLKERCLRQVRRELITDSARQRVLFLAGRRRSESARRAEVVESERQGSVIWASPLVNWSKIDLNTYRNLNPDCPRNEVSDILHMSGECLCGSFAHSGEREEIRTWFPEVVDAIEELERDVLATGKHPAGRCQWGHGGFGEEPSEVGMMCSSCEWRGQTALPFDTVTI